MKYTKKTGSRYWTALLLANLCGMNLGDFAPDVFGISAMYGFIVLLLILILMIAAARRPATGGEAYYWIAVVVVRAAATNFSDFLVSDIHLPYFQVIVVLVLIFVASVAMQIEPQSQAAREPSPPGVMYWLTLLLAGSIGTMAGDGIGRAFSSVQVGVPVSALVATLVLLLIRGLSAPSPVPVHRAYWAAVLAAAWWGTSVGDISAHFLSVIPSALITGVALAIVLITRQRVSRP